MAIFVYSYYAWAKYVQNPTCLFNNTAGSWIYLALN